MTLIQEVRITVCVEAFKQILIGSIECHKRVSFLSLRSSIVILSYTPGALGAFQYNCSNPYKNSAALDLMYIYILIIE